MADNFQFEKLHVLNTVYNNTISQNTIPKSSLIKTELYPHQQTLVYGMINYREKMINGFLKGNQAINGKIGIIGDPAGTGKTLSILSYIASYSDKHPRMSCELNNYSSKYFYSYNISKLSETSTNLIIVPHHLFSQWKMEIELHTTIKYTAIETKRIIKGDELANNMINSKFVLTTNKCYKFVQEYATNKNIEWNNIFIDEASSIYINSTDPELKFQFLWLITNNWIPLLFKNPIIIKNNLLLVKDKLILHPELYKWLIDSKSIQYEGILVSSVYLKNYLPYSHPNRGLIVLRNSLDYIYSNINIPDMNNEILQCRPNITLNTLSSFYISRNIEPTIYSNKIPHLFQALGVPFRGIEEYLEFQITSKHNLIKNKIKDNECIICLDNCEYPTMVDCCFNIFCGKCILKNLLIRGKCPTCRNVINTTNMCCLIQLKMEDKILSKNKMDVCLDILKNNKNGKIIIYSSFDNIYYQLFEEIDKMGIKAERIESNLFSLLKAVKNYNQDITNVLFVSNVDLIRGLSLTSTSHLIFYHELPVYELKQVLIHSAQRVGRKSPLKIIHLNSEIQV